MLTKPLAIGAGFLAVIAGGSIWLLLQSREALGEARAELEDAHAVIAQREIDMRTSALEIAKLQGRVEQIESSAAPVRERIIHAPVTTGCGPAVRDAAGWVRDALAAPGGPATGRQPDAPVRPP